MNSSWLADASRGIDGTVTMQTNRGDVYKIQRVPLSVYNEWRSAGSAGKFFNANIRGKYETVNEYEIVND